MPVRKPAGKPVKRLKGSSLLKRAGLNNPRVKLGRVLAGQFREMIANQVRNPRPGEIQGRVKETLARLSDAQVANMLRKAK